MSWPWLPVEILSHILGILPPLRDSDDSVLALLSCGSANSLFRQVVTSVPALWQPHYLARYTACDDDREKSRLAETNSDYRLMFIARRRLDRRAKDYLSRIIASAHGRHEIAEELTRDLSMDVWDALDVEVQANEPWWNRPDDLREGVAASVARGLAARHYWAETCRSLICRHHAISAWVRNIGATEIAAPFEEAFIAMSEFFGIPHSHIVGQLDDLALEFRQYLKDQEQSVDVETPAGIANICYHLLTFMAASGFGAADDNHFHDLFNHFPHTTLTTHKQTLPMSLIFVYVTLCRRMGILALPLDFPTRVLVRVALPGPGPGPDDLFVDVYGALKGEEAMLSLGTGRLAMAGISPDDIARVVLPAGAAPMLLRASRNIFQSVRIRAAAEDLHALVRTEMRTLTYAACCANLLVTGSAQLVELVTSHLSACLLDLVAIGLDVIAPALASAPGAQQMFEDQCRIMKSAEDHELEDPVTPRMSPTHKIQHFVGCVFRHALFDYDGLVYGWTPTCEMPEDWIRSMQVDTLPRGRHQPFYKTICADGTTRYVAEENVLPRNPTPPLVRQFSDASPLFGRFFDGLEIHPDGRARLLLAPETIAAYPEDEQEGVRWVDNRSAV